MAREVGKPGLSLPAEMREAEKTAQGCRRFSVVDDRGERALGLATCQMDKETAIQVIAFVVPVREL